VIIYKAENIINGKIYIGKTVYCLAHRKGGHLRDANKNSKTAFHSAIRKYGEDTFAFSVLEECFNRDDLDNREKFYISILNTMVPNGYNLTPGGDGLPKGYISSKRGIPLSEENKQKLRETMTGRKASIETKQKMSKAHKGNHYNLGVPSPKKGIPSGVTAWNKGMIGFRKGCVSWNKGLTKEDHPSIKSQAEKIKGNSAWNKGLTKETDNRLLEAGKKTSITRKRLIAEGKIVPWNRKHSSENKKEYNHKVKFILDENKFADVYDMEIEEYHNFAIDNGIFVHNCSADILAVYSVNKIAGKIDSQHAFSFLVSKSTFFS